MVASSYRPHALPRGVAQHVGRAEQAVRSGTIDRAIRHLETGLSVGGGMLGDEETTLASYGKLMKITRHTCGPGAAPTLLRHLVEHADVKPDRATVHLAVTDVVYRGDRERALSLLRELRTEGAELSSGSFDAVIQAAGRARDRECAMAAYRLLRRARLRPTVYTLNALINMLGRTGSTTEAVALLRRAQAGAPRWAGDRPDGWSFSTAMALAARAGNHCEVRSLFAELRCGHAVQPTVGAYNVAISSQFKRGSWRAATLLYRRMRDGRGAAPPPRVDTFNTMLNGLHRSGQKTGWLMAEMAACDVQPDTVTLCTLLKMQRDLRNSRRVWHWGRKRDAAHGVPAWHHLAEAYLRHGRPERVRDVIALMIIDGETADVRSHNLYLRSLVACRQPHAALKHIEAMAAAPPAPLPPRAARPPKYGRRAAAAVKAANGNHAGTRGGDRREGRSTHASELELTTHASELELTTHASEVHFWHRVPCLAGVGRRQRASVREAAAAWTEQVVPPDAHSFGIGLSALRLLDEVEEEGAMAAEDAADAPTDGRERRAALARRAIAMVSAAEGGAKGAAAAASNAVLAHSLVASAGADPELAYAIFEHSLRPTLVAAHQDGKSRPSLRPGEQPGVELATLHALMRSCGLAKQPEAALRILATLRKDHIYPEPSCYTAYLHAKDANPKEMHATGARASGVRALDATSRVLGAGRELLRAGYERLLQLECCPEKVGASPGGIETIRIQW